MRLAARITTVLILGILLLMVIAQFVMLKHENDEMTRDMRDDTTQLGTTISHIVDDIWELGGPEPTSDPHVAGNRRTARQDQGPDRLF